MRSRRNVRRGAAAAAVIALAGLLTGCPADDKKGGTHLPTAPASQAFNFLAGSWTGTWTDTRYNVSGSLQATFSVSGSTVQADGTIGLQAFGMGDETGTGTGTISGDTLAFTFNASTVGDGSGSLAAAGAGSGNGTVTGSLNFGAFTYQGTANATTIEGTFQFTSPTGGNGVAKLTKQ